MRREHVAAAEWRSEVRHGATWIWRGRCFTLWPDSVGLRPGRSRAACPPWVPCYLAPPRVPRSLHSQIGGSRVHIQHLSVLDTSVCTGPLTAPSRILRGYSPTPGFPHFYSKLSPPQKESTVLPGSLDYTALSAGPRQLTLLCNHHYPHNCFSIGSQGRQRSSIIQ